MRGGESVSQGRFYILENEYLALLADVMWRGWQFMWTKMGGFIFGFLTSASCESLFAFTLKTVMLNVSRLSRHALLPFLTVRNAREAGQLTWWLHQDADSEIPLTCPPTDAKLTWMRRVGAGGLSFRLWRLAGKSCSGTRAAGKEVAKLCWNAHVCHRGNVCLCMCAFGRFHV